MLGSTKGPLEFSQEFKVGISQASRGRDPRERWTVFLSCPNEVWAPLLRLSHLGLKGPGSLNWPFPSQSQKVWGGGLRGLPAPHLPQEDQS